MKFIFDFDGVLLDSLDEVIVTAFNSVTGDMHYDFDKIPFEYVVSLRKNRFHCKRAGDFVTLATALLDDAKPSNGEYFTKAEFEKIKSGDKFSREERLEQFFLTRKIMMAGDRFAWLGLHRVFEPVWEKAKTISSEVVLMTNKNSEAVLETCEHFGLELEEENVYSGDKGITKTENFRKIKQRFGENAPYFFIDDSLKNLENLEKDFPGEITLALASWGYLGPNDLEMAKNQHFLVDTQESFITRLG